jgi:hypothetical protein
MGSEHSTFSFVLVTLGTAIVLYGTGTQGMGNFQTEGSSTAAKLNVAIAGGAGVLAFCVAFGMIRYHEQMRKAFQIERKFFIVRIAPNDDARTAFEKYAAHFSIDGAEIPALRRGNFYLVYVPYVEKDRLEKRSIDAQFHYVGAVPDAALDPRKSAQFPVVIDHGKFPTTDAGTDLPVYDEVYSVNLQKPPTESLRSAGKEPSAADKDPRTEQPVAPPPIVLPSEGKS